MFYGIKKKIIRSNIAKRQKEGCDIVKDENYSLPPEAGADINNSHFFSAHTMEGETVYVRLGMRGDGRREVWTAWYGEGRFVENDRELYAPGEKCPLEVTCLEPGKKWQISYSGTMKDVKGFGSGTYPASLELVFTANDRIFDFFYDNDPETMAHALASEKWSRKLFSDIEKNNQRHYEQGGDFSGLLVLDGKKHPLELHGARDHSYGRRNWSYMDRHFWILAIDESGRCLNVSMVGYPAVSQIWTGYTTMYGKVDSFYRVECSANMDRAGHSDGNVHLDITLTDGRKFSVETFRDAEAIYTFDNGSYYFSEGLGHFVIDGRPARGTIEFSFNGNESRWKDK